MRRCVLAMLVALGSHAASATAAAQTGAPLEAGVHVLVADSGQLNDTDTGFSGRISWVADGVFGVEAELGFYPADIPEGVAISASRFEGLFGVTAGPRIGRLRPFARLRPGFLRFAEAPDPIACIAIFPPPIACELAGGHTAFALDVGGGIEVQATDRSFVRVDVGDRMVRFPGPAIDSEGDVHDESFFGHDWRLGFGVGWRF